MHDEQGTDLAERVRRLELALADVQAQLASVLRAAELTEQPEQPEPLEPAPASPDLETMVGTYWLSRIGVLALITGVAWFIVLHFGELGAALRVALGYGMAGILVAVGVWFARTQRLFGQVVIGGGLSVVYFVTYALHFVGAVQVIDNQSLGLLLLAAVVVGIVAIAQRLGSETIAGVALFLGFHTSFAGDSHAFTLLSTTLLAAAAMFLLVKNRWVLVPLSSLAAVYVVQAVHSARYAAAIPTRLDALILLGSSLVYFVLFAGAVLIRPRQHTRSMALAFSLGNGGAFVLLGASACWRHDRPLLAPFLAVAALLLLGCAWLARRRAAPTVLEAHLGLALPVAVWALAESLPLWGWALAAGALCSAASYAAGRARLHTLAVVAMATLAAALLGAGVASSRSFLACAGLAAASTACVHFAHTHPHWSRWLRGGGATLAAAAAMLAASASAGSYRTLSWVVVALALVATGLALRERALRLAGLGVLAIAAGKLLLLDLARLPTDQRILTFVVSGAILLGLSFAYSRFKESLQRLL